MSTQEERYESGEKIDYLVGYFVAVRVSAIDEGDAIAIANSATGWPRHEREYGPMKLSRKMNPNGPVLTGEVVRSHVLMVREAPLP
jgi:hypothetical protein